MADISQIESTTQKFLDIFDITNNLVILKDGTTSLIITVDAMNFGLLADEEQDGIIYAYAGLLNSINYPIQIIVRSQTKDVTHYLQLLKDQEERTVERKRQLQIRSYREFVSNLIKERNVLDKKFFVIIPAKPYEVGIASISSVLPGQKTTQVTSADRNTILEKARSILEPKRDHVIAQFARIGLFARQLETQEIIQYFYSSYNPEATEGQNIDDSRSYTTPLVTVQTDLNAFTSAPTPTPTQQAPQFQEVQQAPEVEQTQEVLQEAAPTAQEAQEVQPQETVVETQPTQ